MVHQQIKLDALSTEEQAHSTTYASRFLTSPVPKYELPLESMPAQAAYQLCHDELKMDGNPSLNLASFVTTWMEDEAFRLLNETANKNLVDEDEYPQTKRIERRCVNMLAHLFHAPAESNAVGTSTIGSSEAIMLAGLSHKWRWKERTGGKGVPNIVMSADIQVVWDKFARYFEVEPRIIPLEKGRYTLPVEEAIAACDENTICVVGVLGTTFTGAFDPIKELNDALIAKGLDIPIHVDAASGGFVVPFTHPDLKWDFRLSQVKTINVSGHKYGLVCPGVGWVLWRDRKYLPDDLVFNVNYLGGDMPTFNLNFSRSASQVVAQYYNFLRLGRGGYTRIMEALHEVTRFLISAIRSLEIFEILTPDDSLPLVTIALKGNQPFTVFDLSKELRERGWIVPAYTMPENAQEIAVLRLVVREGLSRDMAGILVDDLKRAIANLRTREAKPIKATFGLNRPIGVC
jgi:glutamate decarboxylase